jgi:MinD-like ATPase involved in chromosome partitioning or flagellar assembly
MGGRVITFYSYKGGTGRSMMLANVAWLLASNGKKVLVIDWDLEAPGLHRYFKPFLVDPDMVETDGLIDIVWQLASDALTDGSPSETSAPNALESLQQAGLDLEDYVTPLKWGYFGDGGIDFIGAGRQGATYSERVNTFNWKRFYQIGGGKVLDRVKKQLIEDHGYDFVFIDSRTGVSDTSGICTMQLPDALVACLTLNRQSIEGVASVLDSVKNWRAEKFGRESRNDPFRFFPAVTRIENSEKDKLDLARGMVRRVFRPFLSAADASDLRRYWDDMEITYRPYYAYEEVLAAFGDSAGAGGSDKTLLSEMEAVARRVSGLPSLRTAEFPEHERKRVLADYALGMLDANERTSAKPVVQKPSEEDKADSEILRNIYAKEIIWRTRDYDYRNLLSQRELQLITPKERESFGRQMSFYHDNSERFLGFRQTTNGIFFLIWVGLMAVPAPSWAAAYLWQLVRFNAEATPPAHSTFDVPVLIVGIFAWLIIVTARIFSAHQSTSRPYGMRLMDVFRLSFLGPLTSDVRDYSADAKPPAP